MTEAAPANQGFSLISNRKLLDLYAAMLACRRLASTSNGRWPRSRANSIVGHEAAAVGSAIDLLAEDTVVFGLHPADAIQAFNPAATRLGTYSAVIRHALARKDNSRIGLLFSSGRQSSEAKWQRSMTLARDHNLPILFVLLSHGNRGGTTSHPPSIPLKLNGDELPTMTVDGNDVVAVYRVASESILHARQGKGPTLIDCRLSLPADPLESMEKYLIAKGLEPAKVKGRGAATN